MVVLVTYPSKFTSPESFYFSTTSSSQGANPIVLSRLQNGLRFRFLESHLLMGEDEVVAVYVVASQSGRQ